MNVGGGEAADQMMRMMLHGGEITLKLGASALKNLIVISVALARNHKTLSGRLAMKQMLQQTRDLRVFPMTEQELKVFQQEAKHEKLLYSVIRDKRTGHIDVILPATDLDRANHVFERMLYRGAGKQKQEQEQSAPEQERAPKKTVGQSRTYPRKETAPIPGDRHPTAGGRRRMTGAILSLTSSDPIGTS